MDLEVLRPGLTFAGSAGLPTRNQQLFDRIQQVAEQHLREGRPVTAVETADYVRMLKTVRLDEFREWMGGLSQWPAIVNLPSLTKTYGGRVFESMAAGRPVISWNIPDRPRNAALFNDGEEILLFDPGKPEELAAQIDRVLNDSNFAAAVGRAAEKKLRRFHTSERRLRETLVWVETGALPDYGNVEPCPAPIKLQEQYPAAKPSSHGPTQPTHEATEAFYVDLFVKKPHWSTPEPNADESARWSKISSFLEHILREAKKQNPSRTLRILDVGCGRGWLTKLASAYGDPQGVEPVAGVVEYARRLFPDLPFTVGTLETILAGSDFEPFDVVLCSEVIEHVPHQQKPDFVRHLARLLTPDGYLVLTTPRGEVWEQWRQIAPPNQPVEDWVTESQLADLFKAHKFHPLQIERVHVEVPSLRYFPAATRHESGLMSLMPIYQVWACRRDGMPFGGPWHTFPRTPMVSVIVPTFNRPERLRTALHSIAGQSFQDYEVVVVNDGGTSVESVVTDLNHDGRITLVSHDRNRGLAASRNTGLRLAKGKYVCYLDDDDRYLQDHLETLVSRLEGSEFKVAYTDAWRVHERLLGDRYVEVGRDLPYSYEFNSVNLLVSNYFPVLCVMHARNCLDEVGMFDESLFAHEDWDLWIRMATKYPFMHIKRTTAEFTWREDGSSMTSGTRATYARTMDIVYRKYRSYTERVPALLKAQQDNLGELSAHLEPKRYDCSIIIPVCNKIELTRQCLQALAETTSGPSYEVIVVDNGSNDGTPEWLQTLGGDVLIIRNDENLGFAKACNQGAASASGEFLVFLNNDTVPLNGWLEALVEEVRNHRDVAVVGSKLLYEDRTVQHAGVVFDRQRRPYHVYQRADSNLPAVNRRRELNAVTAACMLIRRAVFETVGPFDEGFRNGFEDVDLCLKVREQGHRIVYQPRSVVLHLESQTPGRKQHDRENADRLAARWGSCWWLVDQDTVYVPDGYKSVPVETMDGPKEGVVLLQDMADARSWELVASAQQAALRRDEGQVEAMLRRYREWPADASAFAWAGGVALAIQRPELARELVQHIRALGAGAMPDLNDIRDALREGDLKKAENGLTTVLVRHPHMAEAWLLQGLLHMQRNNYREAGAAFQTALRDGAESRKCRLGLGMSLMGENKQDQAWEEFVRVLDDYPDDADAVHWLLRAGTASQRWKELAERLSRFVDRNPADLSVRFALAGVLVRAEQVEAARKEYDTLRALAPDYDGLTELGQAIAEKEGVPAGAQARD
jgi:GT2 family glycosyltransferase/SAM-dependent methyltransferase/tetratricopeptide (TPR) repeat protein